MKRCEVDRSKLAPMMAKYMEIKDKYEVCWKDFEVVNDKQGRPKLNIIGIFLFAISVSFDAFTTGIGLRALISNIFLATSISPIALSFSNPISICNFKTILSFTSNTTRFKDLHPQSFP